MTSPPPPGGASLPARARVVIIGGGVGGASLAYHLAQLGERDVVLLDRHELTSGSTFHSAGLVGQLRSDPALTRMNMSSVELYRRLEQTERPPGWRETGSIRLASSPERLQELRRQLSWARAFGLDMQEISPSDAADLFPLMSTDGVLGGVLLPSDGQVDPSQLCYSLAAGAREAGVSIVQHTRVVGITVRKNRVRGVRTDRGDIEAEIVVNCGGMFAAEIGRLAEVRIPVVPLSHQYVVTEPVSGLTAGAESLLPSLRDPDLLVYFRQEGNRLLMGGYERQAAPFTAGSHQFDGIPQSFNSRLLPEDWDRFAEIGANAAIRVPVLGDTGIRTMVNGPEAFTPDNEFCLGETVVDGLFVSAGFCAHGIAGAGGVGALMAEWIVGGEAPMNVAHMDINRFGPQYASPSYTLARTMENYQSYYDIRYPGHEWSAGRGLRRSPVYGWNAAHGASFGEKNGWERVNFYTSNEAKQDDAARPRGWAGAGFSSAVVAEHRATREAVAIFDESSFAKILVNGPDAVRFLEWMSDNRVARGIGQVSYTQLLNSRGGIEADLTVTRTGPDNFWLVTGTASGGRDLAWLRRHARDGGFDLHIADMTGQYSCFALWGPRARVLLQELTPTDLAGASFRFMTSQEIPVGDVPVRAQRVSFVGELGWELYAPVEYGAALWESLWTAGQQHGLVAAGYRAIDTLRLEKGYRVWGSDITAETDPLSAGLDFCIAWDKPGGFKGLDALRRIREEGPESRLSCLTIDDPTVVLLGGEPVRADGAIAGRVTSGGFGHTVGASIGLAYLPVTLARVGTPVEIDVFGVWVTGSIAPDRLL